MLTEQAGLVLCSECLNMMTASYASYLADNISEHPLDLTYFCSPSVMFPKSRLGEYVAVVDILFRAGP